MSQTTQDLWPADIAVVGDLKPPLVILREQAILLGNKTNNLVEGIVVTQSVSGGNFRHIFIIESSTLSYSYPLFSVSHPPELYPAIIDDNNGNVIGEGGNQEGFIDQLKKVLSSDKTKKIISALLAQAQGEGAVYKPRIFQK